jgi:DNA-binding NarL/FixJ family response regulator
MNEDHRSRFQKLQADGVITAAEFEVLNFRDRGFTHYQIANGLGLSRSAVRDRLKNAYRKIAVHERENPA